MRFEIFPHTMEFVKPAKTSRGEYHQKTSYLIHLSDSGLVGVGEAAPLPDLSVDGAVDLLLIAENLLGKNLQSQDVESLLELWDPGTVDSMPSLRFALH